MKTTNWSKSLKAHFERVREIREVRRDSYPSKLAIKSNPPHEIKVIFPKNK